MTPQFFREDFPLPDGPITAANLFFNKSSRTLSLWPSLPKNRCLSLKVNGLNPGKGCICSCLPVFCCGCSSMGRGISMLSYRLIKMMIKYLQVRKLILIHINKIVVPVQIGQHIFRAYNNLKSERSLPVHLVCLNHLFNCTLIPVIIIEAIKYYNPVTPGQCFLMCPYKTFLCDQVMG